MKSILLIFLFFQFSGTIYNDTQNKYLIRIEQESVYLPPFGTMTSPDSLVFVQRLDDNGLGTSLGWAIVEYKISEARYLKPCLINHTKDTLLIAQNRYSFIVYPQQKYYLDKLYVDFDLYVDLEINRIVNGQVMMPEYKLIQANRKLEIIIAP